MARIIQTADLTPAAIAAMPAADVEHIYNGLDCAVTMEIAEVLKPQLDNVTSKTYAFSRALQAPILEMSLRGVLVDQVRRKEVLTKFKSQITVLESHLYEIVRDGVGFPLTNWRSTPQLKDLFESHMNLSLLKKRKPDGTYGPAVDREALEKLSFNFHAEPICNHILALRDLDKKRQFLETGLDPDGRIRTNFNIAGTNTGRLASSMSDFGTGTNLQNVDRDLRSIMIPDPGMKFGNLDLEQGDARNVGAICWNLFADEDEAKAGAYLNACESGDLHTAVCRMAWINLPWTEDPKKNKAIAEQIAYRQDSYRQLAKKLGHGTNYYGTPTTMARHTKVARPTIEEFQRAYFAAFPAIGSYDRDLRKRTWHSHIANELRNSGTLTTLFGRRRKFWGRADDDSTLREAIAFAPQSMTADEIDLGLLSLWRSNRVQLLLQVHDSILFQYPEEQENEIIPWALETLKQYLTLKKDRRFVVPTEAKVGFNWGDVTYDKEGNVMGNADGLIKWKGGDSRKRPQVSKFSLLNF